MDTQPPLCAPSRQAGPGAATTVGKVVGYGTVGRENVYLCTEVLVKHRPHGAEEQSRLAEYEEHDGRLIETVYADIAMPSIPVSQHSVTPRSAEYIDSTDAA